MWVCKNCQNQNEENFRFCWSCGNSKSASRKTVRGNTNELSPSKNLNEKEIPPVNEIKTAPEKPIKKVELQNSIDVEVRTKESPFFDEKEGEVLTQPKPIKLKATDKPNIKEEPQIQKKTKIVNEPEIFSEFSPKNKNPDIAESRKNQTDWQREIFTIAIRLIGLFFIFQVILALPELASLFYSTISSKIASGENFATYLLIYLSPFAKHLFYLVVGVYLISSGKLLLRLLPGE